MKTTAADSAAIDAARLVRRISARILPWVSLLYCIAYLDRSNISYASLEMTKELRFSPEVFGFGAGIFFVGYFLLDVPGSVLVEKWSARKWIALILIVWGCLASVTGFVRTAPQLYAIRFLLGLAEGGFFPAVIIYLTHWFRQVDRGRAAALFLTAIPVSQIIAGPMSAMLLRVRWMGLSGWRWMLLLEGIPAVISGILTLFVLTDRPAAARWLSPQERSWLQNELERERALKVRSRHHVRTGALFCNRNVLMLTSSLFCFSCANYGLLLWMPKMLQAATGASSSTTSLLATIPFVCGLPVAYLAGSFSDRKGDRRLHAAVYSAILGGALFASLIPALHWSIVLICITVAVCSVYAYNPVFYLLPATFLADTSAATAMGMVNSLGHLGGFLGPFAVGYLVNISGSYRTGILFMGGAALAGSLSLLAVQRGVGRIDSQD